MNIDKTELIIFHHISLKRFMPQEFLELFLDGIAVKPETVTKLFLGVFNDEIITWEIDMDSVYPKVLKSRGILYRARLMIPRKHCDQLYFF